MKKFLLLIYCSIYKSYCIFRKSIKFINLVYYFYKTPFAKRHFKKMGIDPVKEVNHAMEDVFAPIISAAWVASSIGLTITGLLSFFCGILKINIDYEYQMASSFIFSFIFFYFYLWGNDKEVKKGFKTFDKKPRWKKLLWGLISLVFTAIAIFLWWKGMVFWDKNIGNY